MKLEKYFYDIGELVGYIKIIDRKTVLDDRGIKRKKYKYKCLKCGFNCGEHYKDGKLISEYWVEEGNIKRGSGCALCRKSSKIVVKGINDIATISPWMIDYLKDKDDAYKTSYASNKKIDMICVKCGLEKSISPNKLNYYGFSCEFCSNGFSYPEKLIKNVLSQLNIEFVTQLSKTTFKWCDKYRYDFYIPSLNAIIESHGEQHYRDNTNFKTSLKEIQENDKIKEQLAKDNGVEHYIVLDCRKSELQFIKNNLLNSKLNELFDLSIIDWNSVDDFIKSNSLFINIKNDINNNIEVNEIINKYKISKHLYYKIKNKLIDKNLINITEEDSERYRLDMLRKSKNVKVICLNNNQIYNSIVDASKKLGIKYKGQITNCCRGKIKHTQKYEFMYHEDYLYCIEHDILGTRFDYIKNKYKRR